MLEVIKRSALARSGTWTIADKSVTLPAIAFVRTERFTPPDEAELVLAREGVRLDQLIMVDQGSKFHPSTESGDLTIEPDLPYPLSLKDLQIEADDGTKSQQGIVVHPGANIPEDAIREGECRVFVVGNAVELIRHPKEFADELVRLRKSVGYRSLIYVPGLAVPSNLAFLCYCSADIVDSTRVIWESRSNHLLTAEGRWPGTDDMSFENVLRKNLESLAEELRKTVYHIQNGTLREFVEKRAVHDPWMIAALRQLDLDHYEHQELHFPVSGQRFHANTLESLHRPDIIRFRKRIRERHKKPKSAKILLLLPCSARKPYSMSKTHGLFQKAIKDSGCQHLVHEVIVTSPLGIVPRELELFYPAQNYDIPVTGHWTHDEIAMIRDDLRSYLEKNKYDHTLVHLGTEMDFVTEALGDHVRTAQNAPPSSESLSKLTEGIKAVAEDCSSVEGQLRRIEDMNSRCVFQFGEEGEVLTRSVQVKGRYPSLKIMSGKSQVGMLVEERGMISLTLEGAERISSEDAYCVQIDDFHPEGNVFAIGVDEADARIRIGDEVVVRHGKDVRGVGTAVMNWKEMIESSRGEAVRIRHKKKA